MSLGPPGYGTSWVPSDLTEEPYALTRTYGSVRGAAGNGRPYRDCSLWLGRDSYKTIVPATAEHPTATAHALFFGGSRFSLVLYEGGSVEALDTCAQSQLVTALYALDDGEWVSYILGAPEFVNREFRELFADGLRAITPLVAKSEGPPLAN